MIGLVTMQLLLSGAPATIMIGTSLMLNGLARFGEKAYRGEPQTQVLGGRKIYQRTALTSFLAGTVVTMIPSAPVGLQHFGFTLMDWVRSLVPGALVAVAMGVDCPDSKRRFSRLI